MKSRLDARLREEALEFRLEFACESCAHFQVESSGCANGYPNRAHRQSAIGTGDQLEFCKEFELV